MKTEKLYLALIVFVALALVGCARPVTVPVQMPAASSQAMQLRTVSVARLDGDRSGRVGDALERFLTRVQVDRRPWFNVVQPVPGRRLGLSETMRRGAGTQGAVYSGRIIQRETPTERYRETRRRCVARKPGGGLFKKCLRWNEYTVPCLKRSAVFAANIEVVSPRTGQIVHSTDIASTASDSGCGDATGSVASSSALMGQAVGAAISKLDCEFAPCTVQRELVLMNDATGLTTEEAATRFSAAHDYVTETKGQGLRTACAEWIQLVEVEAEETVSLLFNVAACYEVNGEYDQAMGYLNRAKALHVGINPEIETAINRIQDARGREEILIQQKRRTAPGS